MSNTINPLQGLSPEEIQHVHEIANSTGVSVERAAAAARAFAPAKTAPEVLPGGLTRAQFEELAKTNPFAAGRYISEYGITPQHVARRP